jgi:hypothetical protein
MMRPLAIWILVGAAIGTVAGALFGGTYVLPGLVIGAAAGVDTGLRSNSAPS